MKYESFYEKYPRNLHALFVPWCVVVNFVFCITVSVRCTTYIMSWVQLYSEYLRVLDPFLASRTLLSALTARCLWHNTVSIDGPLFVTRYGQHWRPVVCDTLRQHWRPVVCDILRSTLTACCLLHTTVNTDGPLFVTYYGQHWRPVVCDILRSTLTACCLWHTTVNTDGPLFVTHCGQHWRPAVFETLGSALTTRLWNTGVSTDGPVSLTHCDQHWQPVHFDTRYSTLTPRCLWHTMFSTGSLNSVVTLFSTGGLLPLTLQWRALSKVWPGVSFNVVNQWYPTALWSMCFFVFFFFFLFIWWYSCQDCA